MNTKASTPQPPPVNTDGVSVTDQVVNDLHARREFGRSKYGGIELETNNGRKPLWDAYQEVLDLVLYLRQELIERGEIE